METKDVPHGAVASVTYHSKALDKFRRMHVYTPPGYETSSRKYPVFYLLHGAGDCEVSIGCCHGAAGQYQKGVEQLNAALKIDPKHTGAFLDLAFIAASQDRYDEARAYYQKVIDLTEGGSMADISDRRERAYYGRGMLEFNARDYEAAIGDFKASLRIKDDASDTYFYLASALESVGQPDEAALSPMALLDPTHPIQQPRHPGADHPGAQRNQRCGRCGGRPNRPE